VSSSVVVIVLAFVALAAYAAAVFGLVGVVVTSLMGASCWYGYAIGHLRGHQSGVSWYADMLREKGLR
jgi:hypothetical protein